MGSGTGYLLDNAAVDAGERFGALAAIFDPGTFRHVEALGVRPGWRCWEVGAGGPSVARWLAGRVGPAGRVLATDVDVAWLDGRVPPNVEVRRHDVAGDEPPDGAFDLVHARLVLTHVPERLEALRRMAASLRPGGWLLVEDFDVDLQRAACLDATTSEHRRANAIRDGFVALLARRGVDLRLGRKLPRLVRDLGLADVAADAYFPLALPAAAALDRANVNQVAAALVAQGHATADEVADHLGALDDGRLDVATPPLVSAWGRRR